MVLVSSGCVLGPCYSFKGCVLPSSLLSQYQIESHVFSEGLSDATTLLLELTSVVTRVEKNTLYSCSNISRFSRISFFLSLLFNFWLCWVFVAARKMSLVATSRDYSPVVMRGLLIVLASLVSEHGLWSLDFGSCGTQA